MHILQNLNNLLDSYLHASGLWGGVICCLLILVEPLLPFLPMFIFVTINLLVFGYVIGFILSYIFAVLGCLLFYVVVSKLFRNKAYKFYKDKKNLNKLMEKYKNMKFETLTTIISLPFTPGVMINGLAALSGMPLKKYMTAEIIAKIFITIFWGFMGVSLIKCLKDPKYLIIIFVMLVSGYIISKIVNRKYNLD